ncbi:MAG: hypothetical protein P1V51_13435 [Deltaproteobacteria bacterium]|nr:hypothetical protein [Deltaproteobacteria bacterium]
MDPAALGEALLKAVTFFDAAEVERLLEAGADPDHRGEDPPDCPPGVMQPVTPLTLVIFRISDCDLLDDDLRAFERIAALLLARGADPTDALRMAEERYGAFPAERDPEEDWPSLAVWRRLVEAGAAR